MRKLLQTTILSSIYVGAAMSVHANTSNYFVNGVNNEIKDARDSADILQNQLDGGVVDLLHNTSDGLASDLKEVVGQIFNFDGYYAPDGSVASDNYVATVLSAYFNSELYNKTAGDTVAKVVSIHQSLVGFGRNAEAQEILDNTLQAIGCGEDPRNFGDGATTRLLTDYECEVLQFVDADIYNLEDIVLALTTVDQDKGAIFLPRNDAYSDTNSWLGVLGNLATNKINLACHSQGNEFCNRLATYIDGQGYGDNVQVLSVATPDNYVFESGKYITLKEDLVASTFLGSLPKNAGNHSAITYLSHWAWPGANIIRYGDITGHGFNESYMSSGSSSKAFIVSNYIANHDSLVADDCPECFTGTNLPLGYTLGMWNSSYSSPDYYNSGYAKDYTFTAARSCQKVEFKVGSEVDSYIDLRTNGVLIGANDNGGGSNDAKLVRDINGGTYNIELTGKSLYSNPQSNRFGITITDLGACDSSDTSNIYVEGSTVEGDTSNIYVAHGDEIRMRTYQKYSGNVSNSDLPNPNLEYIFSRDRNRSSNDLVVETDYSTIGSDDVSDGESEYYTIPDSLGTGRWYVGFVVDADNEIQETDESDNVEWIEITVSSGAPSSQEDVYLEDAPDSDILYVGERSRFRIKQYYSGDQTSSELGSIRLRYYLSKDQEYSSNDEYLGYDKSSIGSNDAYDSESFYFTPGSSDKGLRFIIFELISDFDLFSLMKIEMPLWRRTILL